MIDDREHPANAPEQEIASDTPEFADERAARTIEPSALRDAAEKQGTVDSSSMTETGPESGTETEPREAGSEGSADTPRLERLQKILAQAGIASRRHAEELITQGRVQVNGQTVTVLGTKADPQRDHIRVDGKLLHGAERLRYFVLNKPKGYVTTVADPEGRPTVMEFFAKTGERLYPVGRLDYQSEGLLLVTNDGELANQLTRAASGVEKTYLVKVAGHPDEEQLDRLRGGIAIDKGRPQHPGAQQTGPRARGGQQGKVQTAPARIRQIRKGDNPWYEVVLIEGRNRELRKMFEEIGHHVEKIRRVGYGPLVLDVPPGKTRELIPEEVEALRLTAAGKLKPRRLKATHMLPKDAGKRADTVEEKPRRFERETGPVKSRESRAGRFEPTEERRPGARPKFGGRTDSRFAKGGRPEGRPSTRPPGDRRERFRRADEGRGARRNESRAGFEERRPPREKRGAEGAPRSFESRRFEKPERFNRGSKPSRGSFGGFRPRSGEEQGESRGQRPSGLRGGRRPFGEDSQRRGGPARPPREERPQSRGGAQRREGSARPLRRESQPSGEQTSRAGRPARPVYGERNPGPSYRGKPGGKPGGRPGGGRPAGGAKRGFGPRPGGGPKRGPGPGGKRNFGKRPK